MRHLYLCLVALLLSFAANAQISGPTSICVGSVVTYTTTATGGAWSSSNTAIASIGSSSGIAVGIAVGVVNIIYTVGGTPVNYSVTVNPSPGPITATSNPICVGATTTVSPTTTTGGVIWSLSSTTVATISPTSPVVTGVSPGTTAVTFTLVSSGCSASTTITVNASPTPISGPSSVCVGAAITLSSSGGSWTSSNTSIATVGATTGIVFGNASGVVNITITPTTGCFTTKAITVNPLPAAISGSSSVCSGSTITLSSASGGTWSSGATGIATVGTSGTVTGIASGVVNIITTLTTGCFATKTITVNPLPPLITGSGEVCIGSSILLSDAATGGTWHSGNLTIAVTGSSSGIVTGLSVGTSNITYTLATGCFTVTQVTANTTPLPITGPNFICLGGTATYTTPTLYGSWSSTTVVATIGSASGVTTGVTSGTTIISYNTGGACAAGKTVTVIATAAPIIFTITGGGSYCSGSAGVVIGLSGSTSGMVYTLYNAGSPVATVTGTGAAISFGTISTLGTYTVIAAVGTPCATTMTGSATVSIALLPAAYTVTGGMVCAPGSITVGLNGSQIGVNYRLICGVTPVSSLLPGTGSALSFGVQTTTGIYTVIATSAVTSCTNTMLASAGIVTTSTVYNVTGGGAYCAGSSGVGVGLNGSQSGASYQLYFGSTPVGSPFTGTGLAFAFPGLYSAVGTYSVTANPGTSCAAAMTGSVNVGPVNPTPAIFTVTGGTACSGGSGIAIGLSGSQTGVTYALYRGAPMVGALSGTGSPITFGTYTTAGTYTAIATTSAGCTANMSGNASIITTPTIYSVTGGGAYCTGGSGVLVGISGSQTGVSYQLYSGATPVGLPTPGIGSAFFFAPLTTAGTYTIIANPGTSCSASMTGSATVSTLSAPTVYTVTGGGSYCSGGSGVAIGLSNSQSSVSYQLYSGATAVGSPVTGTGSPISFGSITAVGTYTVTANPGTSCSAPMSGSATVSTSSSPTVYTVTGGGSYCAGGSGVAIGLSGSQSGISYQLYNGATAIGSPLTGTGSAISFGSITAAGTYTVTAHPAFASTNMTGTATIVVNPLPTAFAVTGGASCSGAVVVGLSGSQAGVNYTLYRGTTIVAALPGTGAALSYGLQSVIGTYTVVATNTSTGCSASMTGSAIVATGGYPAIVAVTGGGSMCVGGTGVAVGLAASATGVSYQLYLSSVPVGSPVMGIGGALSFGPQIVAGTYTVMATNTVTGCTAAMSGSAVVSVYASPSVYTVTGGGAYCAGGSGVAIGLSSSATGVTYRLYRGTALVAGPITGTGAALSFGLQTVAGTYTVTAMIVTTFCTATMSGSATVVVNPLPNAYTVTGGGSYCSGGAGLHIYLSGSDLGISYQLMRGTVMVGSSFMGTGSPIDWGLQTTAGTYTVVATNVATGCSRVMTGSATITINPLPVLFTVTGGGSSCSGTSGIAVGLSGSQSGVTYQLFRGIASVGSPVSGTGAAISFGPQSVSGIYMVIATNIVTGCIATMSGSATISVSSLPTAYTLAGGGTYCVGSGNHITLSSSDVGVTYRLYLGTSAVGTAISGTGAAIDFGIFTTVGTYTARATSTATGCTATMTGSVTVTTGALPASFTVTGGGSYCAGGAGVSIGLSGTTGSVTYQLYMGGTLVGSPVTGIGAPITFGLQTAAGTYTVIATSTVSGCTRVMSGSVTVVVNPLPAVFTVTGGGGYCSGTSGVAVGLSGSATGISYRLYRGTSYITAVSGTGTTISFGLQTVAGTYTVIAYNTGTGCTANMSGSAIVTVNPVPTVSGSIYTMMPGGSITLTGSISGGIWTSSATGVATVGSASGVVLGVSLGTANISYTLPTGCRAVHTVAVTPTGFRGAPAATATVTTTTDISVLPNPSNGTFTIRGILAANEDVPVAYEVADMTGKTIYRRSTTALSGRLEETIHLGNVAGGMYILQLHTPAENKVFHIVVGQ